MRPSTASIKSKHQFTIPDISKQFNPIKNPHARHVKSPSGATFSSALSTQINTPHVYE